jgi:hypothetical protein
MVAREGYSFYKIQEQYVDEAERELLEADRLYEGRRESSLPRESIIADFSYHVARAQVFATLAVAFRPLPEGPI